MAIQSTFAIIKPEAIAQKLVGKIITQIEDADLKIVKMKMMQVSRELAEKHYAKDDAWCAMVGGFMMKDYEKAGKDPVAEIGTADLIQAGRILQQWTISNLISAPVIIMELTGENAVAHFREVCGKTEPIAADPKSIRGMYSKDSNFVSLMEKRTLLNLVHGSGNAEEAAAELAMWFPES